MISLKDFRQLIKPLEQRILGMVAHGVVKRVDDAHAIQEVQAEFFEGETRDGLKRMQQFGFTSNPDDDAEVVAIFRNGDRGDGYVISIDDGRYRIKVAKGEVALYDKTGSTITLKTSGDIELAPSSGKVKVTGAIEATGEVTAGAAVPATAITLTGHKHGGVTVGSGSSGGPVP